MGIDRSDVGPDQMHPDGARGNLGPALRQVQEELDAGRSPVVLGPVTCRACGKRVVLRRMAVFLPGHPRFYWAEGDTTPYSHVCIIQRETCVCGGPLRLDRRDSVADVIRTHQAGPMHVAWRLGMPLSTVKGTFQVDGFPVVAAKPSA